MGPARSERPREGAAAPRRAPPDPDPRSRSSTRGDRRRIPSARRPSAAVLDSDAGKERRVSKRCRGRGSPPGLSPRLRMAAECRCSRCAARQPERRRPPRIFSFRRIIREYCQNTARKEKIRGYVRYRLPSVPISALARRGTAVFSQGSLPRTAAAPRAAHGAEEHPQLCAPFPAAAATRGPPPPFHRAAPSGRPAQRCRRPTALPPTAPPLPPFGPE